jgi:hypothetical protein
MSRLELNLANGEYAPKGAIDAIEDSFPSLGEGKLRDLVGVTGALLEEKGRTLPVTRLNVEVVRGRVRGDVDYAAPSWGRARRRGAQLAMVVAGLRERCSTVRSCGVNDSRTGVWFDLGPG